MLVGSYLLSDNVLECCDGVLFRSRSFIRIILGLRVPLYVSMLVSAVIAFELGSSYL